MGLEYAYDSRIVVIQLSGDYSTAELRETVVRALDDRACPVDAVLLFDVRGSSVMSKRTSTDVQEGAGFLASIAPRFSQRMAFVANVDLSYGLMRMCATFMEHAGCVAEVFRELGPARAWLLAEIVPAEATSPRAPVSRPPS